MNQLIMPKGAVARTSTQMVELEDGKKYDWCANHGAMGHIKDQNFSL